VNAADGVVRWRKSLRSDFAGKPGVWAYAESPLIDGANVICTPGGPDATIAALNKTTGEVVWKCQVPGGDQAAYASLVVGELAGVRQIVGFLQKGIVGVDAKTGKFLWRYDKTSGNANIATPVIDGGVYSAGSRSGGALVKISGSAGAFEATEAYFSRSLPSAIGGTVAVGGHLYGTTNAGLVCVDLATGTQKWQDPSVGVGSICVAGGRIYLHGENGNMALVEVTPEAYREKGRFTPPDPPTRASDKAWAYPVVANGNLFVRDVDRIWCFDVKSPAP
jgi:outer membrane protein assembly factor BamB